MNEKELLHIVQTMAAPGPDVSGDELERLADVFEASISHPGGNALLYYPDDWGLPPDASPEQIVKEALSWRPQILAMRVSYVRPHPWRHGTYCIGVEIEGRMKTQIVSQTKFNVGDVCAVALSGIKLPDGRVITHGFIDRAYSAGEILGLTDKEPGVELNNLATGEK